MTSAQLEALRAYLQAQGMDEEIYIHQRHPKAADRCLLLTSYEGGGARWHHDDRFQVRARGVLGDDKNAWDLAHEAHGHLFPAGAGEAVRLSLSTGGAVVRLVSGPLPLGRDERGRFEVSFNYRYIDERS